MAWIYHPRQLWEVIEERMSKIEKRLLIKHVGPNGVTILTEIYLCKN